MKNSCCMCFFTEVLPYQEAINFARLIKRGGVCSTQVRAIRPQPSARIIVLTRLSLGAIFQNKAPYKTGFEPARVIFSHLLTNQLFRICCWCLLKRRRTGVEPASRGFQGPHSTAELPASYQGAIVNDKVRNFPSLFRSLCCCLRLSTAERQ